MTDQPEPFHRTVDFLLQTRRPGSTWVTHRNAAVDENLSLALWASDEPFGTEARIVRRDITYTAITHHTPQGTP